MADGERPVLEREEYRYYVAFWAVTMMNQQSFQGVEVKRPAPITGIDGPEGVNAIAEEIRRQLQLRAVSILHWTRFDEDPRTVILTGK
jgi:hypothetical protein